MIKITLGGLQIGKDDTFHDRKFVDYGSDSLSDSYSLRATLKTLLIYIKLHSFMHIEY